MPICKRCRRRIIVPKGVNMSVCPRCKKKVKTGTGNKQKVKGVLVHKTCPKDSTSWFVDHQKK